MTAGKDCQSTLVDESGMIRNCMRQWAVTLLEGKANNLSSLASKLLGILTGYH
jgi:hypothetical protein